MVWLRHHFVRGIALWLGLGLGLAACGTRPAADGPAGAKPAASQGATSEPTASPRPSPTPLSAAVLPDLGPAPDFNNETWLNTDQPLTLAALRGRVVLLEFWTFG